MWFLLICLFNGKFIGKIVYLFTEKTILLVFINIFFRFDHGLFLKWWMKCREKDWIFGKNFFKQRFDAVSLEPKKPITNCTLKLRWAIPPEFLIIKNQAHKKFKNHTPITFFPFIHGIFSIKKNIHHIFQLSPHIRTYLQYQ